MKDDFKPKRFGLRIFLAGLVVGALLTLVVMVNIESIRQWSLRQLGQSIQAEAKAQQSVERPTSEKKPVKATAKPWPMPEGGR